MAVYTVHVPSFRAEAFGGQAPPAALGEAQFVREGFSRAAFFLGPFWLAWHRLWIALILWFALFFLLMSVAPRYFEPQTAFFIGLLLELLLGLEGNNLRRLELARLGYRLVDVAAGRKREDAERGFFRRHFGKSDGP